MNISNLLQTGLTSHSHTSLLGNISSIDDETITINERKLIINSSNHILLKTEEYRIIDIELLSM